MSRNRDRAALAMAFVLSVVLFGVASMGQQQNSAWPAGESLAGWLLSKTGVGNSQWSVETDQSSPSKGPVLKQSGVATYPIALWQSQKILDGRVQTTFKAIDGREDRAAGLIWRARDADTYYVVRANALEDNVVAYKTVKGTRTPLDIVGRTGGYGVTATVKAGDWHTLAVAFQGTRFTVFLNERELFQVEDATLAEPGFVGLWTKADSVTAFADFSYSIER